MGTGIVTLDSFVVSREPPTCGRETFATKHMLLVHGTAVALQLAKIVLRVAKRGTVKRAVAPVCPTTC